MIVCMYFNFIYIFYLETGRKTLKLEAIPTQNLPIKSHDSIKPPERRHINIVKDMVVESTENIKKPAYKDWTEFCNRVQKLKLHQWNIKFNDDSSAHFQHREKPYLVPKFEVIINDSLEFTCVVFGWSLPNVSCIYKHYMRSLRNITISELLKEMLSYHVCRGIDNNVNVINSTIVSHTIPCELNPTQLSDGKPNNDVRFQREKNCFIIVNEPGQQCQSCHLFVKKIKD